MLRTRNEFQKEGLKGEVQRILTWTGAKFFGPQAQRIIEGIWTLVAEIKLLLLLNVLMDRTEAHQKKG